MNNKYSRDKHYKNKTIKMSDEIWDKLKEKRRESGKSWNMFIKFLINKIKKDDKSKKGN
jgi:hypothetical protein